MSELVQIGQVGPSNFAEHDKPTWELYSTCIHCGLCLNHCPTYRVLGTEMDSPRGRIYQVLQVDTGRLPIGDSFVTHIDRCLGCLACETVCPSGVQYGQIAERARAQIETRYRRPPIVRMLRWLFYKRVLRDQRVLARGANLLRMYQRSGLQRLVRATRILHVFGLATLERLAPEISERSFLPEIGTVYPAVGERRARVAFHAGCVGSVAFADLNRATVRVLTKNGVEVCVFANQECCGALHAHGGLLEDARALARRNVRAWQAAATEFDAVITNSAGCGSHLKQYADLLRDDQEFALPARELAEKTRDVTEFLEALGLRTPARKVRRHVTYQDPCHLAHAQRIRSAPRMLLAAVGVEVVEMPHSDQCCGSAGVYNVSQNELSMKILAEKMQDVASVSGEVEQLVTANTGCMLQLRAGVEKHGLRLPVRHVVEVLDECY
jgi:glycolate oxidase iron-sulfur subunit